MKLAVIFPGIGYHADKPLLYYSKRIAQKCGFEIVEVPYGGFGNHVKGSAQKMQSAFESALLQTEQILQPVDFEKYNALLFISKSIGTAVAGAYAKKHGLSTGNIYYTPVEPSFQVMDNNGVVFFGTADPWTDEGTLERGCHGKHLPYYKYKDANHSLETGNVLTDLRNLSDIMEKTLEYVKIFAKDIHSGQARE